MGPFLLIYLKKLSPASIHGSENRPCFTALHFTTLHLKSHVIFILKKHFFFFFFSPSMGVVEGCLGYCKQLPTKELVDLKRDKKT
jgi:hypothetical protein